MKKTTITIILIILLSIAIGVYSYYNIQESKIASHWDAKGQVNGYMSKFWGIFLVPIISIGLYLLFLFIPKIDPLKKNILKFRNYYDSFILIMMLFLFYVFVLTILANLGYVFNMTTMLMPAIGLLFFCIGIIFKKLKRNWFIGIRTPWTMSNDQVWEKTHKLGSVLFKIEGIILLLGVFFPAKYFLGFVLIPILVFTIWLFLYSYLEYKKIKKR
jgi:uncharacterized membrane protein